MDFTVADSSFHFCPSCVNVRQGSARISTISTGPTVKIYTVWNLGSLGRWPYWYSFLLFIIFYSQFKSPDGVRGPQRVGAGGWLLLRHGHVVNAANNRFKIDGWGEWRVAPLQVRTVCVCRLRQTPNGYWSTGKWWSDEWFETDSSSQG